MKTVAECSPQVSIYSETSMIIQAAFAGVGVAYCLEMQISEHLRSGRLTEVMPG